MEHDHKDRLRMLVILAALCVPLLAVWLVPAGGQVTENRTITQLPDPATASYLDAGTYSVVDSALRDRIGLRSTVATVVGKISVDYLHESSVPTVILGKDSEPFLTEDFTSPCYASPAWLEQVRATMLGRSGAAAAQGKYLLYIEAPDKSAVRPDDLGWRGSALTVCSRAVQQIMEPWGTDGAFPLITMWDEVGELDDRTGAYLFGDSHWNWHAGALMTRMLIERLVADGQADAALLDDLDTVITPRAPEGDLYRVLGLQRPELADVVAFDRPDVVTTEEAGPVPAQEEARYTSTATSSYLIPGRTLFIRDSYANLTQLPQFFEDLTVMNAHDLAAPGALALRGDYDRIIFEQVQRSSWLGFSYDPLIG